MIGRVSQRVAGRAAVIFVIAAISVGGFLWVSDRIFGLGLPLDDAWIHQTYARNLVENSEWAFLPGQPSSGSTAPLWTVMLAIGRWLGIEPRMWGYSLGCLLLAFSAWIYGHWMTQRSGASIRWWFFAAILLAF